MAVHPDLKEGNGGSCRGYVWPPWVAQGGLRPSIIRSWTFLFSCCVESHLKVAIKVHVKEVTSWRVRRECDVDLEEAGPPDRETEE